MQLHIHLPRRVWTFWRDAGEWEEQKHPRAKGGQFAKKGTGYEVSSKASALLKSHGYAKEKGAPLFKHPSGETVMFHPPEKEGAKVSFNWGHYHPEHGQTGSGHGLAALHQHLGGTGTASAVAQAGVKKKGAEPAPAPAQPTEAGPPEVGHLKPGYIQGLAEHGFKHTLTMQNGNMGLFENEAGTKVKLYSPEEGKKSLSKWTIYSPAAWEGHEAGIFGEGLSDLGETLASEAAKTPVPTPSAPAAPPPKPAEAPKPAEPAPAVAPPKGVEQVMPHIEEAGAWTYYSTEEYGGNSLAVNSKTGEWEILPEGAPKEIKGTGQESLNAAFEKFLNAEFEKFEKPAGAVTAPKGIEEVLPHASDPKDFNGTQIFASEDGQESLAIKPDGSWQIWQQQKLMASGKGQETLNAEFEKLHPRGPGGKFQAKPGGAEPTKVPKSTKTESFTQGGPLPPELNGVKFTHFDAMSVKDWGQFGKPDLVEPPMQTLVGKHNSAGLLIQEPDGRVWIMHPSGGYGGVNASFPKGTIDPGETPQQAAIREAFEESGIVAQITGFAGDYAGTTSNNRFYFAKRVAGSPTDFGHETSKVTLVPPEELGKYLNQDRDKKIAAEHYPPAPPKAAIGAPIDPATLKKVGPQLGSNPGFQGEDAEGNRYYVKQSKSPDHAKNELLAAALYDAVKSPILNYHPTPGDKGIVTDWQQPDKPGGVKALTPAERKMAQAEFAVHAWLGNWDAAGTGGDNQQVIGGKPTTVDVGGALLYRAQGAPKGKAWGPSVGEWDTLRDPSLSPDAAGLFKDMTKEQLQASVARIEAITPPQILKLVIAHGPGDDDAKGELAATLIQRREDLIKRAKALDPPPKNYHSEITATQYAEYQKAATKPTADETYGIKTYTGGAYSAINRKMRKGLAPPKQYRASQKAFKEWLNKQSWPEDGTVVTRWVGAEYAKELREDLEKGFVFADHGFCSSDHWNGDLVMKISLPKGAKAAAVRSWSSNPGEYEITMMPGSRFIVEGYEPPKGSEKAYVRCRLLLESDPEYHHL